MGKIFKATMAICIPLIIIGLVLLVLSITNVINIGSNHYYSGRVVFNSEADYSQFKTILSNSRISFDESNISALSSEPPIIVSFKDIIVPNNVNFPYGDKNGDIGIPLAMVVGGCLLLIVGMFVDIFVDISRVSTKEES
jgi:hypothetical protein